MSFLKCYLYYLPYRYLAIECGQCRSSARCRVAMDENDIRIGLIQHIAHTSEYACRYVVKVLPLLHYVEIVVRLYIEDTQHLVQHLAMLAGHADQSLEVFRILLEFLDQGAHFNCLRPGSENEQNLFHM